MAKLSKRILVESDDDSDDPSIDVQETPRHLSIAVQLPLTPVSPELLEIKNRTWSQDIAPESPSRRAVLPRKSVQSLARAPFGSPKKDLPQRKPRKVAEERNKAYADETRKYLADRKGQLIDGDSEQSDETLDCIILAPAPNYTKRTRSFDEDPLIRSPKLIKAKQQPTGKKTGTKAQLPANPRAYQKGIAKKVTNKKPRKFDEDPLNEDLAASKVKYNKPVAKNLLSVKAKAREQAATKNPAGQEAYENPASPEEQVKEAIATQTANAIIASEESAASKQYWDLWIQLIVDGHLSLKAIESVIDEHTPWKYLIYEKFSDVAPEEQALLLLHGLHKGWLSPTSLLHLAVSPPLDPPDPLDPPALASWIAPQLQLSRALQSLGSRAAFSLTRIFAAMSFNPALAALPAARLAAENARFRRLDDAAFAQAQREWPAWAVRDLPIYYLAFSTAQAQLARAGVHTCWMQTVAFLGARRGGLAAWDLDDVAAEDLEFLLPGAVAGLSRGLV